MTAEEEAAIAAIRAAYQQAGSPNGPACITKTCLNLAARRVFWPALPGQDYPLYCDACAAWARKVLEDGMGIQYRDEMLPPRPGPRRGILLERSER